MSHRIFLNDKTVLEFTVVDITPGGVARCYNLEHKPPHRLYGGVVYSPSAWHSCYDLTTQEFDDNGN